MTEQSHTGKILLSVHHEDMKDCKQISPDEPSLQNNPVVTEIMENYKEKS